MKPDQALEHNTPSSRCWRRWLDEEPALAGLSWDAFRHELRHGPDGRQDELLAALVRIARSDRDAVAVMAACLAPGLRRRILTYAPGLPADDAWGEAITGLCAAIDSIDLSQDAVAGRLLATAKRHLQRAVRKEVGWRSQVREVPERPAHGRVEEPSAVLMLTAAVSAGALKATDAWLLHTTVIAGHSLEFAARRLGLGYEATKKRRQRAGHQWAAWWDPDSLPACRAEREAT